MIGPGLLFRQCKKEYAAHFCLLLHRFPRRGSRCQFPQQYPDRWVRGAAWGGTSWVGPVFWGGGGLWSPPPPLWAVALGYLPHAVQQRGEGLGDGVGRGLPRLGYGAGAEKESVLCLCLSHTHTQTHTHTHRSSHTTHTLGMSMWNGGTTALDKKKKSVSHKERGGRCLKS